MCNNHTINFKRIRVASFQLYFFIIFYHKNIFCKPKYYNFEDMSV